MLSQYRRRVGWRGDGKENRVDDGRYAVAIAAAGFLVAGYAPELAVGAASPAVAKRPAAAPKPATKASPVARVFVPQLRRIGQEYSATCTQLSAAASWAPELCAPPRALEALVDPGTASGPHGRKLYFLYVSNESAYRKGGTQPVGQTIVKEAWHPRLQRPGEALERIPTTAQLDGKTYVPGEKGPLFVMTKLAPKTPDTDRGWVYATLTPDGTQITSAGRVASCMGCHEKGTQDRLFRKLPASPRPGARKS